MSIQKKRPIRRGDIYYADLTPVIGSEQGGFRPVLVIQNNTGNLHSPTIIAALITGHIKKQYLPTHVRLARSSNGLLKESTVMLEQIRTLDKARLHAYLGNIGADKMNEINSALGVSIGLMPAVSK